MAKRKLYIATFSNGETRQRSTTTRNYTHAYLAIGTYVSRNGDGGDPRTLPWKKYGFSASPGQARKNMDAETAWYRKIGLVSFAEVAEAVIQ